MPTGSCPCAACTGYRSSGRTSARLPAGRVRSYRARRDHLPGQGRGPAPPGRDSRGGPVGAPDGRDERTPPVAMLGTDVIGYIEVETFEEGERLPRHGGWADIGNLRVTRSEEHTSELQSLR